jgi:hypothetical protein
VRRRLAWFLAAALVVWVLAAGLAYLRGDATEVAYCSSAALLCLLPTVGTLIWAEWCQGQSPEQQLTAVLGGTGVRMFFVLGTGLLLTNTIPFFGEHQQGFWLWLLLFYLLDLALEMTLLVAGRPEAGKPGSGAPVPAVGADERSE